MDEVQTINFRDPEEIIGALKGYLETGESRVHYRKISSVP